MDPTPDSKTDPTRIQNNPTGRTAHLEPGMTPVPAEVRQAAADPARHFGPEEVAGRPRYYKLRLLGQGGMGTVHLAWDNHLGRHVALKFLSGQTDETSVRRFRREAQACASIRHPHIVAIHEADVWQRTPYIVMDYIEGGTLAARFRERNFTRADMLRWVALVARALQAAHDRGVIHRDIKPQNIFVDLQGFPYLADFGLAKSFASREELTVSGSLVGTPSHMAPEQAAGDADRIGPWTDIYALGVILYEGLTGRLPFTGENALAVVHKILYEAPPPPRRIDPSLPAALEAVVLRAMAHDPRQRFASAADLAQAIERAQEPGAPAPTRQAAAFPGRVLAVPGVGALLALAAVVWFLGYRPAHVPASGPTTGGPATPAPPTLKLVAAPATPPVAPPATPPAAPAAPAPGTPPAPAPGTVHIGGPSVLIGGVPVGPPTPATAGTAPDPAFPDLTHVRMRTYWHELWKIARQWKTDAQLVQVNGFGVRPDGTVDASHPGNYLDAWMYHFFSPGTPTKWNDERGARLCVFVREGRVFSDPQAGNCSSKLSLPSNIIDSDTIWRSAAPTGADQPAVMTLLVAEEAADPNVRVIFSSHGPEGDVSVFIHAVTGKLYP